MKTAVYDIQRSHGSEVPLEELLRRLAGRGTTPMMNTSASPP
ncbi:VasL domain-containing protein [Xenorhabdus doucetiae]